MIEDYSDATMDTARSALVCLVRLSGAEEPDLNAMLEQAAAAHAQLDAKGFAAAMSTNASAEPKK